MILMQTPEVILRDLDREDLEPFLKWQTSGEWRHLDAPWDGILYAMSPEQEKVYRANFLKARALPLPSPRKTALIVLPDGAPIGFVNRYGDDRFKDVFYLGISICEDAYLNRGMGTIALQAWIDYLFGNSTAHKLELHTWSLNPRMMHVAEKLGFKREGTERELVEWQGVRQDRIRYGLLRREWEENKANR